MSSRRDDRTLADAPKKARATRGVELPSADARHAGATDDGDFGGAGTTETAELPEDASAATLPFTGFQLALMALIGSAVMAAVLTLRRTAAR